MGPIQLMGHEILLSWSISQLETLSTLFADIGPTVSLKPRSQPWLVAVQWLFPHLWQVYLFRRNRSVHTDADLTPRMARQLVYL